MEDPRTLTTKPMLEDLLYRVRSKLARGDESEAEVLHRVWIEEDVPLHKITEQLGATLGRMRFTLDYLRVGSPSILPVRDLAFEITQRVGEGYSSKEIAQIAGLRRERVLDIAKKYDITIID